MCPRAGNKSILTGVEFHPDISGLDFDPRSNYLLTASRLFADPFSLRLRAGNKSAWPLSTALGEVHICPL